MKVNRCGSATAITEKEFLEIRECLGLDKHKLIMSIAWYTTERWGAVLQLKTTDLYEGKSKPGEPKKTIVIPRGYRKDFSTREVGVSAKLHKSLMKYRPSEHGYICPNHDGTEHQSMRVASAAFMRAVQRAGYGDAGISTHSTRRGSITAMARAGISLRVIQKITGHASLENLQRYIDFSDAELSTALAVI